MTTILKIIEFGIVETKFGFTIVIAASFALLYVLKTGHLKPDGTQRSRREKVLWICLLALALLGLNYYFYSNQSGDQFRAGIQLPITVAIDPQKPTPPQTQTSNPINRLPPDDQTTKFSPSSPSKLFPDSSASSTPQTPKPTQTQKPAIPSTGQKSASAPTQPIPAQTKITTDLEKKDEYLDNIARITIKKELREHNYPEGVKVTMKSNIAVKRDGSDKKFGVASVFIYVGNENEPLLGKSEDSTYEVMENEFKSRLLKEAILLAFNNEGK